MKRNNAHYLAVGSFVIIATIVGLLFFGWLYKKGDNKLFKSYVVYFSESVDGLIKGSTVRYMGIPVGQVKNAALDPENPFQVTVTIDVGDDTPISSQTIAVLRSQGVTGSHYIGLNPQMELEKKAMEIDPRLQLPIIPTGDSKINSLLNSLPVVQKKLEHVLDQANKALSDDNVEQFSTILQNVNGLLENGSTLLADADQMLGESNRAQFASMLSNLSQASEKTPALVDNLRQTAKHIDQLIGNVDGLVASNKTGIKGSIQDLRKALQSVSQMSNNFSQLAAQVNQMTSQNRMQIDAFVADGGYNLNQALTESRRTAAAIRRLSEKLDKNPSQLLYEPSHNGVELPE